MSSLSFLGEPQSSGGREGLGVAREPERRVGADWRARVVARDERLVHAGAGRQDVHHHAVKRRIVNDDLVDRRLDRGGASLCSRGRRCRG